MNTTTNHTHCPEDLKAKLIAITHDNIIGPHAEKAVLRIKEQLAALGITKHDIEKIETT